MPDEITPSPDRVQSVFLPRHKRQAGAHRCLVFAAYFGAMALVLVFGLNFEDVKYHSVLAGE